VLRLVIPAASVFDVEKQTNGGENPALRLPSARVRNGGTESKGVSR